MAEKKGGSVGFGGVGVYKKYVFFVRVLKPNPVAVGKAGETHGTVCVFTNKVPGNENGFGN